jgi:Pyrimidine dimer DNA glycosylase
MVGLMRLWSLHPKYLDSKGLVALWREGILARAVLKGGTKGYKNHPQLIRFKNHENPLAAINTYLLDVYRESERRFYKFNKSKIGPEFTQVKINVTQGQIMYEFKHLKSKLKSRDPVKYGEIEKLNIPDINAIFYVVVGDIETWEVVRNY